MKSLVYISALFYIVICDKLAVYWGQDSAGGEGYTLEKSIDYYCEKFQYDIIPIAFLDYFFYPFNKDSYPSINLANHCNTTFPGYPGLLDCPEVATAIQTCQNNGKAIILSLGGAAGLYSFPSEDKAVAFAHTIWDLFLGGSSPVRPFGDLVLDGVDLDIEAGSTVYYANFIQELRSLMNTNEKKFIITGAPQCPYPDAYMGPGTVGTVLGDIPEEFDYLFVQFYNNYCYLGNTQEFNASITSWFDFASKTRKDYGKGPLIFIGLPSHPRASSGSYYYQTPDQVKAVYQQIKGNENLGGIMLWDASFDMNNIIKGRPYSSYLADFLKSTLPKNHKSSIYYCQEVFPMMPHWLQLFLVGFTLIFCVVVLICVCHIKQKGKEKDILVDSDGDLWYDLSIDLEKTRLM